LDDEQETGEEEKTSFDILIRGVLSDQRAVLGEEQGQKALVGLRYIIDNVPPSIEVFGFN
jgi:hypothetical protein